MLKLFIIMVFEALSNAIPARIFVLLVPILLWELIWKGIGLWKSGRNNQLIWFIAIFIFNTLGILPIIYILFFQKKKRKS